MQSVITTASHKGSSVLSTKPIIVKDINPKNRKIQYFLLYVQNEIVD